MSILQKLTLAEIRHHKSRFVVTVIGVLLSTALVTAVLLGIDSVMASMRRTVVAQVGDYDWIASESVSTSPAATLDTLDASGLFSELGYACDLTGPVSSDYGKVDVIGVGGDAWELLGAVVSEGTLPAADGEAAVYADFARQYDLAPGDTLTLPGADGESRSYTVTAVLDRFHIDNHFVFPQDDPGSLILTATAATAGTGRTYYWGKAVSTDTGTLQAILDLDEEIAAAGTGFNGWFNSSLLAWSGVQSPGGGDNLLTLVGALRMFLLLLIAAAAVLMIYNAFSISLAERRRTLGMLASAGATPEQRSACILYEALAAGVIGIPLGLAAACAGLALTFALTAPLIRQVSELIIDDFSLTLSVRPVWLILSAATAAGVLLLSAWVPALHAGRTGPIDAIRGTGEVKLSRRALRGGRLFGRVLGPEYVLARKNARRSIHRYRATLLSLTMSVVLMVTASGFAQYLETAYAMGHRDSDYNITARLESYDLTADITADPGFATLCAPENAQTVRVRETVQWGSTSLPADRFSEQQQELSAQTDAANAAFGLAPTVGADGTLAMSPYLIVLSDEEYAALTGADASSDGQTLDCLLVNRYLYTGSEGGYIDVRGQTSFQPGDTIDWDFNTMPVTLNIRAVLDGDDVPEELVRVIPSATSITFVTGRSAADAVFERFTAEVGGYCRRNFTFSYQAEDREALMDELSALSFGTNYYSATDQTLELANLASIMALVRVALYGFTALIALVCAANIANTVSSGMAMRRRESAVLRSVGMTPRSLRRMIFWESGIYGLKALCWGLPVSGVLLWFVYRKLTNLYVFSFTLPWGAMVLAGAAMVLLSLAAAWPALRRAGRTTPADDLRRED